MAANFETHLYSIVKSMIKNIVIFLSAANNIQILTRTFFWLNHSNIQQKESIPIISVRQVEMLMLENYVTTVNTQYTC